MSLALGQDQNFDQLNYHFYVGYAFLHGTLERDVVPAGIQTFQPPFLHALHYLGVARLPPRVFGFVLGTVHGLNVPLLLALALVVLRRRPASRRTTLALVAAGLGVAGPAAVSMIGTTFGDNLVTLPALVALALALAWESDREASGLAMLVAAGVAAGLATGLKLTMGTCAAALLLAILALPRATGRRLAAGGAFVLGCAIGFVPTGGVWALRLYGRFGNPVFPFANGIFRSPWFGAGNFGNDLYATRSVADLLRPVVDTALGRPEHLQEVALRDLRLALLLVAAIAWALVTLWRRARRAPPAEALDPRERAFLVFWVVSYLLWAVAFPYYRYLTLLEMTAPLAILVIAGRVLPGRALLPAMVAVALVLVPTTRAGSWGRRPWSDTWLTLPVPAMGLAPDSLVLLVGQPISYAVPSFREDARFAHLTAVDRFGADARWRVRIEEAVEGHRGPVLLLSNFEFPRAFAEERAASFGFRVAGECAPVWRPPLRLRLCPLARRAPGG
ncbi:MAG: glycosyltransferase 87 family protein [Vicinamibacteria bacterium]